MEKFIPYAKLSKKARRQADLARRRTWTVSPVTRRPPHPKAYQRKTGPVKEDDSRSCFIFCTARLCLPRLAAAPSPGGPA